MLEQGIPRKKKEQHDRKQQKKERRRHEQRHQVPEVIVDNEVEPAQALTAASNGGKIAIDGEIGDADDDDDDDDDDNDEKRVNNNNAIDDLHGVISHEYRTCSLIANRAAEWLGWGVPGLSNHRG